MSLRLAQRKIARTFSAFSGCHAGEHQLLKWDTTEIDFDGFAFRGNVVFFIGCNMQAGRKVCRGLASHARDLFYNNMGLVFITNHSIGQRPCQNRLLAVAID